MIQVRLGMERGVALMVCAYAKPHMKVWLVGRLKPGVQSSSSIVILDATLWYCVGRLMCGVWMLENHVPPCASHPFPRTLLLF